MGLMDAFQKRGNLPKSANFILTELGKSKSEDYNGDTRSRILMALDSNGASNIDEISRVSRLSKGTIERQIPQLINGGLVQSAHRME